MEHKHSIMYVLSAIVLLNVIAIVVLNNRLVEPETFDSPEIPSLQPPVVEQPSAVERSTVRTLVLKPEQCPDCYDITKYVDGLEGVIEMKVEDAGWQQFNPPRLPALAFESSVEEYPNMVEGWDNFGYTLTIPSGNYEGKWYVLPTLNPPYYSTSENYVRGRVTVTYLTMDSCEECYDVHITRGFMEDSRITPYREIEFDIATPEGDEILKKYNITNVPTIILSRDAVEYTNLQPGWPVVGTIESDGSYVLRNLQRLQVTYYDLASESVMVP